MGCCAVTHGGGTTILGHDLSFRHNFQLSLLTGCVVWICSCYGEETNTFYANGWVAADVDVASTDSGTDLVEDRVLDEDASSDSSASSDIDDRGEQSADSRADDGEMSAEDTPPDIETDLSSETTAPFSFAVFGDNQFSVSSCTSGVSARMAVPEVVLDLDPTFLLHTGDLMDHGWEEGAYSHFVECYDDMLAAVPFFPTGGNHDFGSGGITRYKTYLEDQIFERNSSVYGDDYLTDFLISYEDDDTNWSTDRGNPSDRDLLPSGVTWKTYYAFRHENAYFISFEQGTRWWTQTPKPWLEEHLSGAHADPTIDFIFVTMHHPMYSATMAESSDGECIGPVRGQYEELFRLYDVTMVFSGHAHNYDRFYVPDDGSPTRDAVTDTYASDGSGVHYIVTGGGGGGLTNGCAPFPFQEEHSAQYSQERGCYRHVTQVEVDGDAATVTIWSVEGDASVYDSTLEDRFFLE